MKQTQTYNILQVKKIQIEVSNYTIGDYTDHSAELTGIVHRLCATVQDMAVLIEMLRQMDQLRGVELSESMLRKIRHLGL